MTDKFELSVIEKAAGLILSCPLLLMRYAVSYLTRPPTRVGKILLLWHTR